MDRSKSREEEPTPTATSRRGLLRLLGAGAAVAGATLAAPVQAGLFDGNTGQKHGGGKGKGGSSAERACRRRERRREREEEDRLAQERQTDIDILNFALNLEYLEAEFYSFALTGAGIPAGDTAGTGTLGGTTGGGPVPFADPVVRAVAVEIAADELAHVRFLRGFLGAQAVAKPAINLTVLGIGFGSDAEFLIVSRALEDTGVSAYAGAAGLLSDNGIVSAAARILATEAYHAGNIRLQVVQKNLTVPALDARDQIPTLANFFPTDENGLAIARTVAEVKAIVAPFFPNGLNGNIR